VFFYIYQNAEEVDFLQRATKGFDLMFVKQKFVLPAIIDRLLITMR
jgi:hypothetical protein